MCARVTSTYMEFTFTFGPKPEFKFSFKLFLPCTVSYVLPPFLIECMFGFLFSSYSFLMRIARNFMHSFL